MLFKVKYGTYHLILKRGISFFPEPAFYYHKLFLIFWTCKFTKRSPRKFTGSDYLLCSVFACQIYLFFSIKFGNIHFFENKTARLLKRHGRICKRSISAMIRTSLQIIINRVSKKVPLE